MAVESINASTVTTTPQVTSQPVAELDKALGARDNKTEAQSVNSKHAMAPVSESELTEAVEKLNDFTQNVAKRDLSFSIDKDTNAFVVQVTDRETKEVIRQMPTEEALAVAKQIESMLGLILNDKA